MSQEKSTIGENIKKYRNKLGISHDVLLKKVNLVFSLLLKLKQKQPRAPKFILLKH